MRDIIYNELMKQYAPRHTTDPVYVANTNDALASALTDYLNSEDDLYSRAVLDEVAFRISLVWHDQTSAFVTASNILNILALDDQTDN